MGDGVDGPVIFKIVKMNKGNHSEEEATKDEWPVRKANCHNAHTKIECLIYMPMSTSVGIKCSSESKMVFGGK